MAEAPAAGRELARDLEFWKGTLAGTPSLDLPTDRPRPSAMSYRGGTFDFVLEAGTAAAVRQLAAAQGATLFTTLLSVFSMLLGRLGGQTDIVVGTPIANRTHLATESMPGQFANTLVLRIDTGGDPDFTSLVRRTTDAALAAYAHQELPFEILIDALNVPRDPSRTPLFQVFFILQNAHDRIRFAAPGLAARPLPFDYGMAKFDLTLSFEEQEDCINGTFEYATDLFEPATIRPHGRALPAAPGRRPGRAGGIDRGRAAADGGGGFGAGGMERDGGGIQRRPDDGGADRRAGGPHPRGHRRGVRGCPAELSRARSRRRPPGPSAAGAASGAARRPPRARHADRPVPASAASA